VRAIARAGIGALVVMSGACAHFRVAPIDLSPATVEQTRRVHAVAWGALEPRIEPPNCNGNGLASVTVKFSMKDALTTGLTLGFWSPVTVTWTCAKDPGGVTR
jgi:hypothetical protein